MTTISEQASQTAKRPSNTLSDAQLDRVTGGTEEIHFTRQTDKSSTNLFAACATGKHF